MATPLEKARKDPDSMKGRILKDARRLFGEYGYHGATTRMIAEETGIDISTLHYHWGEKRDLFEAVVQDVNYDLRTKLNEVEKIIKGQPLSKRLGISINMMTEYLFDHPDISNLALFRYFGKTRVEVAIDFGIPEFISGIAVSMGLTKDRKSIPDLDKLKILSMMNSIHNFVSGEAFFRSVLGIDRDDYIAMVKETLKFILIPAFAGNRHEGGA